MKDATEILLKPGETLYREGDDNRNGYLIESGEVVLYKGKNENRLDCERRGPGSIVGELSILTDQPRAVTVEAITECRIYRISSQNILQKFNNLDPVLRACIETSISFTARFNAQQSQPPRDVPLAENTLRDADALIAQIKFEKDIVKGLETGQFSMRYQPIVSLPDGKILGSEALIRWEHPQLGFISPDKFISVAEELGSIGLLTDFALSQACATLQQARNGHCGNDDLFMSVNVSGADIGRRDFLDHLEHLLDLHDLPPESIKLEVTETALVPTGHGSKVFLKRVKEFGCGISIDDFGTGYSNLAYLKSLPLTALKIDRAFAGDAHKNAVSRGIVRMLVGLGAELGVDIIAEGLETGDDVATLQDIGCKFAQGFYFHKPLLKQDYLDAVDRQTTADHDSAVRAYAADR